MNTNEENSVQADASHGDATAAGKQPETQSNQLGTNPAPKAVNPSTDAGIEMTVVHSNPTVRMFMLS